MASTLGLSTAQAEFASRKIRYVSSYDVLNLLIKNFPGNGQERSKAIPLKCDSVMRSNRDLLGASAPASGQPLMDKPNPGFIRWLNQCLVQYTKFEFVPENETYRASFVSDYLPARLRTVVIGDYMTKTWTSIPDDTRAEILDRIAQKLIGPPRSYRLTQPKETGRPLFRALKKRRPR